MKLATRYWCQYELDITGTHTQGNGKPTRKRCAYCGGPFIVETGLWGVFHWAGYGARVGDYSQDKALRLFNRESSADKVANDAYTADNNSDLVVRWIYIKEEAKAA